MESGGLTRQEMEEKFLTCCIGTKDFQDKVRGIQKAKGYFSKSAYTELFKIILKMETGFGINLDLLREKLTSKGLDLLQFNSILFGDVSSNHMKYYFKGVKSAFLRQKTDDLVKHTGSRLMSKDNDINEVLSELSKNLSLLQEKTNESRTYHIAECLEEGMVIVNGKLFTEKGFIGLPSGITAYDNITRGFQGERLYVVAARPSHGKTTLGINFAGQIGINDATAFFTLEMSKGSLAAKLIQIKAKIDFYEKDKDKKDISVVRAADAIEELEKSHIYINDSTYQTVETFTAEVKKLHREGKCKCVVLDYIGLVSTSIKNQKKQEMISDFSRACKILAGDLKIPVIILAQLNRDIEKDGNRKPRKSDLRDSGSIEQDADNITFIHNMKPTEPNNTEFVLVVDKERDGRTGDIPVKFNKKYQLFEESSWPVD